MDQNSDTSPGIGLPQSAAQYPVPAGSSVPGMQAQPIQGVPDPMMPPPIGGPAAIPQMRPVAAAPAQPVVPPANSWLPPTVPVNAPQEPAGPMNLPVPEEAQDADLIETEWVLKAKEIVANTRDDPYMRAKEINRLKAEYLKKRYDKSIEVTEN